jgi:hypothetical protein
VPQALSGRTYFRPGWPASFVVFRCGVVNAQAHSPEGGAAQGWRESNTHSAGFGDRLPSRWVIPMHTKSRPSGFPASGSWPELVSFLSRSLRHPQNACRSQGRGYARIPFVSLVTDCPEFHGFSLPVGVLPVIESTCGLWGIATVYFRMQVPAARAGTATGYRNPGWELDNAAARMPTRRSVISRLRDVPTYEPDAGATSE